MPDIPDGYFYRAMAYEGLLAFDAAIRDFTQAIELIPFHNRYYHARALLYHQQRDFTAAIADYDYLIAALPRNAHLHYDRGRIYQDVGDIEQAVADYESRIRLNREEEPWVERASKRLHQLGVALPDSDIASEP
jgi:tetratricopeptide (TPR) repeat protein